ncbi:MAG: MIP/aquaporin family protein [Methanomassiliicoccus sp.]|nr:MIP/aquaporin family protein [Methanomassiliicoccus sp.]
MPTLKQNLLAEFIGSLFLVVVAIASTILPFNVLGGDMALSVFVNAFAVALVLFALIETFASISGAHFNPAVTIALLVSKDVRPRVAACYIAAQFAGGFIGLLTAHLMFYDTTSTLLVLSDNVKSPATFFSEFVGTFMLVGVIIGCVRGGSSKTSLAVAFLVGGLLVTTSSTMFANPMVTFNRMFTYAICGIAPQSAVFFIIAEILGALAASLTFCYIFPSRVQDKCDPYDCRKPSLIRLPPTNGRT